MSIVLTRIDALFFVIIFSVYLLFFVPSQSLITRLSRFVLVSGVAFVVSLPWWAYNVLWFGSIIPTSGRSQQDWIISLERFKSALFALLQVSLPMPLSVDISLGTVYHFGCRRNLSASKDIDEPAHFRRLP
jgi:hypothetical protein